MNERNEIHFNIFELYFVFNMLTHLEYKSHSYPVGLRAIKFQYRDEESDSKTRKLA